MSLNRRRETAYQKALAQNLIVDTDVIRERVIGGDAVFAQRVLVTALIKGDEKTRADIPDKLEGECFFSPVFALLFRWVSQELTTNGRVEEDKLYQKMKAHVRDQLAAPPTPGFAESHYTLEGILPGNLAPIDHVLAIEMPDEQMIDKAISSLHKLYNRRLAQKKRRDAPADDTAG